MGRQSAAKGHPPPPAPAPAEKRFHRFLLGAMVIVLVVAGVIAFWGGTDSAAESAAVPAASVIDFNRAYHPYRSYDERYDCPLLPPENLLKTAVRAGERVPSCQGTKTDAAQDVGDQLLLASAGPRSTFG